WVPRHDSWWVSPFGHPRITVRLSTPRGLTQTPTSFVGSSCQGIHRAPFKTYGNTKTLCAIKIAYKMLASTMQFSKNNPTPPPPTQQSAMEGRTSHTPPKNGGRVQPHNPIACLHLEPTTTPTFHPEGVLASPIPSEVPIHRCSTHEQPPPPHSGRQRATITGDAPQQAGAPAAPSGTATLLRLPPDHRSHPRQLPHTDGPLASGVTYFRDLTGGVYKARERIHRSVADLRLLATPTSWGRVADPNPN